jgi:hypothetical protein
MVLLRPPPVMQATCKRTTHPSKDSHAQHELTTTSEGKLTMSMMAMKNLYHRTPSRPEEGTWHPKASTGRSRREHHRSWDTGNMTNDDPSITSKAS